jgi:hypothetical protein
MIATSIDGAGSDDGSQDPLALYGPDRAWKLYEVSKK